MKKTKEEKAAKRRYYYLKNKESEKAKNKDWLLKESLTLKGVSRIIYNQQKRTSITRGHQPPAYSLSELEDWLLKQPNFESILDNYKIEKTKWSKPSVDRVNNSKPYEMDNIQLMTWKENFDKESKNKSKSIQQFDLDGNFIQEFESVHYASRQLNLHRGSISQVCSGVNKTCGGFVFKFK